MEEIEGWLLDVTAEGDGKPYILCWAKDRDGKTFAVSYRFKNYFYVLPKEGSEKRLETYIKGLGLSFEILQRSLRGKVATCYKVYAEHEDLSDIVNSLVKAIGSSEIDVFEDDVRYANKFLISNRIKPSSWFKAIASNVSTMDNIPIYEAESIMPLEGKISRPPLKVLALDCLYFAEKGTARPERDPIVAIFLIGENFEAQLLGNEVDILKTFISTIQEYDPDVIVGFGLNRRHWQYLMERAIRNKIVLSIGRLGSEPQTSLYGHVSIRGRINIDLEDIAKETPELGTLEEYARSLGLTIESEIVEEHELYERWRKDKDSVLSYYRERAKVIRKLYSILEDYIFSLSEVTGIPADHVLTAATGFRVENYLMYLANELGELIPKRGEVTHISYMGGMVKAPTKGMHSDVAVIDFRSMYPSIMIKYNISFDTISEDGENVVPGLQYRFKKGMGFLPRALTTLMAERRKIQEILSSSMLSPTEEKVLQAKQKALKVIANAIYGYTGWSGARWYAREVAESTTAWGREIISSVHRKAEELGLPVLYSDTDSIFVKMDEEKIKKLIDWISKDLGLEARIDKVYKRLLFTEAKKRYAGLTEDGNIEVVGLEAVRGDWSEIAKEAQISILEALLKTGAKDVALQRLLSYIKDLKNMNVPLKKLIIWKQITKPLDEYEANQPHVVVAKKLISEGWHISPSDKVGYIIKKGSGRLYEKAEVYFKVKPEDVDWDYYINKQVLPACIRILEAVGITEKDVLKALSEETLMRFF